MIVPGPAGYSCNKVAVAVTDVKYQFCLKRCDLILFRWNKLLPNGFKFMDLLLWQQVQDELWRTKWSKIGNNQIQRTELATHEELTPGVKWDSHYRTNSFLMFMKLILFAHQVCIN